MYVFEKEIQTRLIAEGLQELLTCDLIGPSLINIVQDHSMSPESIVSVLNPTSIEQSVLRTSLLPGLLQVVKYNIDHQNHHLGGFEIGKIHFKDGEIYKEQSVAAIILTGKSRPHHWDVKSQDYDFFDLKGMVENILSELGVSLPIFKNLGIDTFHSGRQASIFVNSLEIGSIGEIHPAIQRRLDVPQRLLFGEFNLHDLMQVAKRREKVESLTIYPGSERDWTFTISETIPFHSILEAIRIQKSHLLENVFLLDVYRSDKLGPGYQNLTLRFIYRDSSKTVAQEIVEAEHHRMMDEVIKRLGEALKS
jgi:phenylalanyl-tRNA synthetase beta chain